MQQALARELQQGVPQEEDGYGVHISTGQRTDILGALDWNLTSIQE